MVLEPVTLPSAPVPLPTSPNSGRSVTFAAWNGTEVQDSLMDACAALFSNNYGIWGPGMATRQGL